MGKIKEIFIISTRNLMSLYLPLFIMAECSWFLVDALCSEYILFYWVVWKPVFYICNRLVPIVEPIFITLTDLQLLFIRRFLLRIATNMVSFHFFFSLPLILFISAGYHYLSIKVHLSSCVLATWTISISSCTLFFRCLLFLFCFLSIFFFVLYFLIIPIIILRWNC